MSAAAYLTLYTAMVWVAGYLAGSWLTARRISKHLSEGLTKILRNDSE